MGGIAWGGSQEKFFSLLPPWMQNHTSLLQVHYAALVLSRLWGWGFAVQPTAWQHPAVPASPPHTSTQGSLLQKPRSSGRKSLAFAPARIWDVARACTWNVDAGKYLQISQFRCALSSSTCKMGTRPLIRGQELSSPVRSIERFI